MDTVNVGEEEVSRYIVYWGESTMNDSMTQRKVVGVV